MRFELMAALLRADRQPEASTVVDVRCVDHTRSAKIDHLCLVLTGPPAEPWSADSIRDVFTIDVMWRTPGGWEGGEARTALGAG
ncbi:hypothetical protein [Streptomyces sp. NPDC088812]|uniref:hypothetical protein n=1 Tax=Streptomyces sp. NPDC088812 TaxID=3365905 RepID=UPI00382020CC